MGLAGRMRSGRDLAFKERNMRIFTALAVMAASLAMAACNTVEGAGRDISAVGHAISGTAHDAK